ncbi:MAG: COR domain-containing protein [Cyanobacteria bacterium P01_D01_bin.1]
MTQDELLRLIDQAAAEKWTTLDLAGEGLSELPPEIGKLTNLKTLVLGRWDKTKGKYGKILSNDFRTLPDEIEQLTELRSLFLYGNKLQSLPSGISKLKQLRNLTLAGNQLDVFPPEIESLTRLVALDISDNKLRDIPEAIGALDQLRTLNLSFNSLSSLPQSLEKLQRLESLSLLENKLTEITNSICNLTSLEILNLVQNRITTLPKELSQLGKMRVLQISTNNIQDVPDAVYSLESLETLNLMQNRITEISDSIALLKNLKELDLSGNGIISFPSSLFDIEGLRSIDISRNKIGCVPREIARLKSLVILNLGSNDIRNIPREIGQLRKLRTLDLSANRIEAIPCGVSRLNTLKSLYLGTNKLASGFTELKSLTFLERLSLSGNQLTSIPCEVSSLKKLKSLDLSNNRLASDLEGIEFLTNLEFLYLESNQLRVLPKKLFYLRRLKRLILSNNQLVKVPKEIQQLRQLTSLDLSENSLLTITEEMTCLPNLQELIMWDNKISQLPVWIRKLENLMRFDLRANRLPIPPEIFGNKRRYADPAPVAEVIEYYFSEKSDISLYEAKLLVGEGGAGKTTLAKKLQSPDYKLREDEKSTEGIEVIPYKFDHPDGHPCKVNIWDFGGQEIYHATHQFFLTNRAVYALVTDSRQGNTDFYFWLNVIQLHGADSPVILIKNEKQGRPCSVPDLQLRGQFVNLKESIETDLLENRNLDSIKATVEQYIANLPHVGDPLPKTWASVRSILENQALGSDNYISIYEYRQICESQGVTERAEQERLSRFLHNLGVFLHFQAIPQLAKTIFLTPQWSTDAVYKVLDTPKVRKDCGRFASEDLNEIWKDNQYKDVQSELLALMKQFEVCYEITGLRNHYIAPHLLEANLPEGYRYDWDTTNNLVVTYHYPFKPKNIFPRFIVSLHPYIERQKLVWKHGVVLNTGNTRAEIIEDARYDAANINIRISGTDKKRLLAIIGHELERIHSSFENLNYETRIPCNCSECKSDKAPYQFAYNVLQSALQKHRLEVQCQKSFEMVNVRRLIDDVIEPQTYLTQYVERNRSWPPPPPNPFSSYKSPFSNKLDITVNFPEQNYEESSDINVGGNVIDSNVINGNNNTIGQSSDTIYQYGPGDNIGGDKVMRDRIGTQINRSTDLAAAISDIQAILAELDQRYDKTILDDREMIEIKAVKAIVANSTIKARIITAIKEDSAAIETAIDHPAIKSIIDTLTGFMNA